MSETALDVGAAVPPPATPARKSRAGPALACVLAVAATVAGDYLLRSRQQLVAGIANHDISIFLPFSEGLGNKVERKMTWNQLHARLATDRANHNAGDFAKASYDLSDFIEKEISADDSRRRDVLLDLVAQQPEASTSAAAYWLLLAPAWKTQLAPSYPAYTAALIQIAQHQNPPSPDTFQQLATVLNQAGEPALELQALRALHATFPIRASNVDAMNRLLALLPANDPDRATLVQQLTAYQLRQDQLTASAHWYAGFVAKQAKASLPELEALRATAPAGPVDSFIASADAALVDAYLLAGRYADANALRVTMAGYDLSDEDDSLALAGRPVPGPTHPAPRQAAPLDGIAAPDTTAIGIDRWRGKLIAGHFDEAETIASSVFTNDLKALRKTATSETQLMAGQSARLAPVVNLQNRTADLPPELGAVSQALFGQFMLKPVGKAVPAAIHSSAEIWLAGDVGLLVFSADEPRATLPAPKSTARDQDVSKDESVEVCFDPDRWIDLYYQLAANAAGVLSDARISLPRLAGKRPYRVDRSLNLALTAAPVKTAAGWQMRLTFPRTLLCPDGEPAFKFNVRRFRYSTEKGQTITQLYSWAGSTALESRPEQFGWVIFPRASGAP